jgi:hypothetical protein
VPLLRFCEFFLVGVAGKAFRFRWTAVTGLVVYDYAILFSTSAVLSTIDTSAELSSYRTVVTLGSCLSLSLLHLSIYLLGSFPCIYLSLTVCGIISFQLRQRRKRCDSPRKSPPHALAERANGPLYLVAAKLVKPKQHAVLRSRSHSVVPGLLPRLTTEWSLEMT